METATSSELRRLVTAVPGTPAWAVAFAVPSLREVVDDASIAAMFGLEPRRVPGLAAVVLSSEGRVLHDLGGPVPVSPGPGPSAALATCLDELATEGADCVGVAETGPHGPVAMCAHIAQGGAGRAEAAFSAPPEGLGALRPMLAAVGVLPTRVQEAAGRARVEFRFDLGRHVESAILARFGRTMSCVEFFRAGPEPTGAVADGLGRALAARVRAGAARVRERALELARADRPLTMTALASGGRRRHAYGDLVPAGVLLAGLRVLTPDRAHAQMAACADLRERLLAERTPGGWAFHRGTLPTATDSALVLLGLRLAEDIAALERYADGAGGHLPQRTSDTGDAERMRRSAATAHWEQADLVTTCLVRHLRRGAGLPEVTPAGWISARLGARAGLFTASPWLVDMAVALAVEGDSGAGAVADALRRDLLAARNEDGSFGRADERPLATAAAVVALGALGVGGRVLGESQLRLTEALEDEALRTRQVPFASTTIVSPEARAAAVRGLLRGGAGLIASAGTPLALTTYEDTAGAVTLGLATLALARPAHGHDDTGLLGDLPAAADRYRRADVAEYVARDGMPPYLARAASGV